jgi:YbbR domain-containing protein
MSESENSGSPHRKLTLPLRLSKTKETKDNKEGRRISGNLHYKILAVLLAMVLWFYAANERGVIHDRVFDNIPVAVRGLEGNLVLIEELPRVQITLRGSTEGLNVKELTAYLDLNGIQTGETVLPVQVNVPGGVTFVGVKPNRIKVNADLRGEKQIPVEIKLSGRTAPGWITMAPTVKPSQVVITGGKTILENIQKAYVNLDLQNTDHSLTETVSVKVYDGGGTLVEGIKIVPASAEVFVPVIREQPLKTVPVKAVLLGVPVAGYQVQGISVEPENINIIGLEETVENTKEIQTLPIDISGLDKTAVYPVKLVFPPGIDQIEPIQVTVVVRIAPEITERELGPLIIQTEDKANDLEADLQPREVSVRVTGRSEVVKNLSPQELSVWVSLAGLSAGKHQVPVLVSKPIGITEVRVSPEVVTVTLNLLGGGSD